MKKTLRELRKGNYFKELSKLSMSRIHNTMHRIAYAFRSNFFFKFLSAVHFSLIRNIISLPLLVKSSFLTSDVRERGSYDESAKNV